MNKYIALHEAIRKVKVSKAIKLIKKGRYLNLQDFDGKTPLHICLEEKNFVLANMLLEQGVELNLMDNSDKTPLHVAIEVDEELARQIIDRGANINIQDDFGETPLHTAIRLKKLKIAKKLIERGANYHLKDEDGVSAIQLAKNRGYTEILDTIEQMEKIERKEQDRKLKKYFTEIRNDVKIASKLEFPDESVIEFLKIKLGYDVPDITKSSIINDVIKLYIYNKEKLIKSSKKIEGHKEITQFDIDKIIWKEPVYIRGICGISRTKEKLKLKRKKKVISLELKNQKRNETGIELEIRKLKRRKGDPTLTKVEGTKDGNINRCFSIVNFGRMIPLYDVGYGTFGQKENKILFVSAKDEGSFVDKEHGIVKKHGHNNCLHKNKGIKHDLKKILSYLRKSKKITGNNEVMMDVTDEDVKFIYYFGSKRRKDFHKLKAVYIRKKFEIMTGRKLPIFEYRLEKIRCLKISKLEEKEVLELLERELINNKEAYSEEFDLLLLFKDEIKSMPKLQDIVKEIVCNNMTKKDNNIYDMVNISKLVREYLGKEEHEKYLNEQLKPKLCDESLNAFINEISANSILYRHRRKNRKIDFKFDVLSECKMDYQKIENKKENEPTAQFLTTTIFSKQ